MRISQSESLHSLDNARFSQDQSNQQMKYMKIQEQSERNIDMQTHDEDANNHTFAMDVNESFGNNKMFNTN